MSEQEEQQGKKGFKVQDRRRFSETGEARPEPEASTAEPAPSEAEATAHSSAAAASEAASAETLPVELTFSTFIISMSTQALAHLGEIPDPIGKQIAVDLGAAKQLIDILGILREKTKGNLDSLETGLLDNVLYDLRIKYVERARGTGSP